MALFSLLAEAELTLRWLGQLHRASEHEPAPQDSPLGDVLDHRRREIGRRVKEFEAAMDAAVDAARDRHQPDPE